ncbi:Acid-sensing ion channel 5 [Apodemus speciosus]|uniref:Acid-sensing ion channel 5 n=1 Tax=Apodemus speciosus TaxID=105296 RepID=A0ABQ0EKN7_APOSI
MKGLLGKIKRYLSKRPLPSPTDRKKFDQDFAISTSFHGIHNIAQNQNKVRKVIWLSVVLGSVSLLVWQIYSRLVNYFAWPTTTSIEVQYVEKIEFPAVTVCNLNRFQTEAVSRFGLIFFLWDIVSKVLRLQEISSNHTDPPETLDFVTNHQNFSITEFVKNNGFYLNHDTLVHCEFFGKTCGPKDFKHIFTEFGNCYTFNHGENIQSKNKEEFTDNPVPGFADAGVIFVIHSPKKEPQFDGLGLSSPVGMHARVTIRQLKTVHQEYPWGECNPDIKLRNFTTYSTYGCLKECKAQHIQQLCGCLPFLLPEEYIERKGLCTMGTHKSSCPVSCEETEYPATVSYSTFPSQRATKFLAKKLNQSQEYIRTQQGFKTRVSLCSPGCPGTHSVDQAGLELRNLPASASQVLGLQLGSDLAWLGLVEAVTSMKKQVAEEDTGVARHSPLNVRRILPQCQETYAR